MSSDHIPGGFYLKARIIQESEISHAPPHVREIWDWFLMKANHADKKWGDKTIHRGQLACGYKDIQDGLCWYVGWRKCTYTKHQCEIATKWLKKATMITTTKTTRGMIVTILNYDKYQNPENYENHNENYRRTTTEPQSADTTNKNVKNKKKKTFLSNSVEFRLANLLFSLIRENNPEHKEPNLQDWAHHVDLMLRRDKRAPKDIARVIRWCQADTFWAPNILSTKTLRRQYDQLVSKMRREKPKPAVGLPPKLN